MAPIHRDLVCGLRRNGGRPVSEPEQTRPPGAPRTYEELWTELEQLRLRIMFMAGNAHDAWQAWGDFRPVGTLHHEYRDQLYALLMGDPPPVRSEIWRFPEPPGPDVTAVSCQCYDCRFHQPWIRRADGDWYPNIPNIRFGATWRTLFIEHSPLRNATPTEGGSQ